MPARTPEDVDRLFAEGLNASNVEAVVALYEPTGVLIPEPGKMARGTAEIRTAITDFAAMKPKLTMGVKQVVRSGDDLAVVYNDWHMTAKGPDGQAVELSGRAIEIVRRQADGTWLFALDDAYARG